MKLGKWGCLALILYLCRNILYILFWGLIAFICYALVYWIYENTWTEFLLEKSGWYNGSQTKD